ncbi:MAG: DUF4835 family protein [Bacteroidetes bacterium]|jgi:hypothetical protein|nr:DUF4835 family protein [Bacteroidota bacterium]
MRFFILLIGLIIICTPENAKAQELQCNVNIVHSKIQGTNKQVFETLRNAIREFMNGTSWTNHVYAVEERIECNLLLNLTTQEGNKYTGTLQIQSRRPVYSSSYSTVMMNYVDERIIFNYQEYDPLEFNVNSHTSNLTSLLAYYAYIIIGMDYDSFAMKGGEPFFKAAERIVNNAQSAPEPGWKAFETNKKDNRFWLVDNILDDAYSPVREFMYNYHRHGLDKMFDNTAQARGEIANYVQDLQDVNRRKPDPFMHYLKVVVEAKEDELVQIFTEGTRDEKARVYRSLTEINPSKSNVYEQINEEQQ